MKLLLCFKTSRCSVCLDDHNDEHPITICTVCRKTVCTRCYKADFEMCKEIRFIFHNILCNDSKCVWDLQCDTLDYLKVCDFCYEDWLEVDIPCR